MTGPKWLSDSHRIKPKMFAEKTMIEIPMRSIDRAEWLPKTARMVWRAGRSEPDGF